MAVGQNKIRFIRNVLYRLKRDYGLPADFYHQTGETVDYTTGEKIVEKTKVSVARAILLPRNVRSDNAYDISFIAASKNFVYGGEFATVLREVVVDSRDLHGFTFDDYNNIYVIIQGDRYEITEYAALEYKAGFHLKLKATSGAQLGQIIEPKIHDRIRVSHDEEGTT